MTDKPQEFNFNNYKRLNMFIDNYSKQLENLADDFENEFYYDKPELRKSYWLEKQLDRLKQDKVDFLKHINQYDYETQMIFIGTYLDAKSADELCRELNIGRTTLFSRLKTVRQNSNLK